MSNEIKTLVFLYDGTTVEKDFYERIKALVEEVISALVPDVLYTAEELCGKVYWGSLKNGDKRKAGVCVSNMVKARQLPLKLVLWNHEYPHKYSLDQTL